MLDMLKDVSVVEINTKMAVCLLSQIGVVKEEGEQFDIREFRVNVFGIVIRDGDKVYRLVGRDRDKIVDHTDTAGSVVYSLSLPIQL
jgi:hypothetical protein